MLIQFRHLYPHGSLISKLVTIDRGDYIVKVSVEVEGTTLATGLAAAETVEMAEDRARERALATLVLEQPFQTTATNQAITPESKQSLSSPQTKVEQEIIQEPRIEPEKIASSQESGYQSLDLVIEEQNQSNYLVETENQKDFQDEDDSVDSQVEELLSSEANTNPDTPSLFENYSTAETEIDLEPPVIDEPSEEEEFSHTISSPSSNHTSEAEVMEITFNDIIDRTDREMARLGWTKEMGKEFLKAHYGKKSRLHLNDEELLAFLHHLKSL
jgi:hypothetical protein